MALELQTIDITLEKIEGLFYNTLNTYHQTDDKRLLISDDFLKLRRELPSSSSYEVRNLREILSRYACTLNPNDKDIQKIWAKDLICFDQEERDRRIDLVEQPLNDLHKVKRDRELNASLHKEFIGKSLVNEFLAKNPVTTDPEPVEFVATIDGPPKIKRKRNKKPVIEDMPLGDSAIPALPAPILVVAKDDLFSIVDKIVEDYESKHIQQKNVDGEKIVQDIIANGEIEPVLKSTLLLATSYATCASSICIDQTKKFIIEHAKSKEDKNLLTDMVSSMLPGTPPKSPFAKGAKSIFDKLSKN